MDSSHRLAIQSIITDGVELVLALREREKILQEVSCQTSSSHDTNFILTRARRDDTKKDLNEVVERLADLPHFPKEFPIEVFRDWMDKHHETFTEAARYCDEVVRLSSPLEEGQVHPEVERLWVVVKELEDRVSEREREVKLREERILERDPEVELRKCVARIEAAHERESRVFADFMGRCVGEKGSEIAEWVFGRLVDADLRID
ncbi:hypothetical protein FB45DRAFT_912983 [Roridomyces roridus]|uniref:Uncharacterized protein n=1 Tax=Roridomyces roridus TaxID=1738132 RepID=A0AAD7FQJ3_9AGAR|nr:hypothetical protein FB45DRAFT_912983 [Roridomyces roridus]